MDDNRLNSIKEEIREMDPELEEDEHAFQVAVILMAASFVTGPNSERLSTFTRYSVSLIADISKRMHQAGLWHDSVAESAHWFDGDTWTPSFWLDTLVADGSMVTRYREDGEREYRAVNVQ